MTEAPLRVAASGLPGASPSTFTLSERVPVPSARVSKVRTASAKLPAWSESSVATESNEECRHGVKRELEQVDDTQSGHADRGGAQRVQIELVSEHGVAERHRVEGEDRVVEQDVDVERRDRGRSPAAESRDLDRDLGRLSQSHRLRDRREHDRDGLRRAGRQHTAREQQREPKSSLPRC